MVGLTLLFALVALVAGRHGLGVNQDAYYLPLVSGGPNDLYRQTLDQFVTWFYPLAAILARPIGLAASFFLLHFLSMWLFVLALFLLSRQWFKSLRPAVLTSLFLARARFSLGGIAVGINHGYVYQSLLAFPLGLLALWLWLKKRPLFAFGLLGLVTNIHSLTALGLGLVFGLDLVWQRRWRELLSGISLMAVPALPTLWLNWHRGIATSSVSLTEWLSFNRLRNPHHLFPFSWPLIDWLKGLWPLLPAAVLARKKLRRLGLVTLGVLFFSLVFTEVWPLKNIIRLQFFRLSMFWVVLGWLALSRLILVWKSLWRFLAVALLLLLTWRGNFLNPLKIFQVSAADHDWINVQYWLRDHTQPEEKLYVLPYLPTMRPWSKRSHNLVWAEMTTAVINDRVVSDGSALLNQYGYEPSLKFGSSLAVQNWFKTKSYQLGPEVILSFAKKDQARFLVAPADFPWTEPPVYTNDSYRVYPLE